MDLSYEWDHLWSFETGFLRLALCFQGSSTLQHVSVFLVPKHVTLYGQAIFINHSSVDGHLGHPHLSTLKVVLLRIFLYKCYVDIFSFLLNIYLGVELLGRIVTLC